jgi:hypothetical protein
MDEKIATQSTGHILLGVGKTIRSVSDVDFQQALKDLPQRMADRLAFMSREHHIVRDFVVREMPRQDRPISAMGISRTLGVKLGRVNEILSELEAHLFFLVRNPKGDVSWAFPVTTSPTPHHLTFSTGEKIFGA